MADAAQTSDAQDRAALQQAEDRKAELEKMATEIAATDGNELTDLEGISNAQTQGDRLESAIASTSMMDAEDGIRIVASAILGLPTGDNDYDSKVLGLPAAPQKDKDSDDEGDEDENDEWNGAAPEDKKELKKKRKERRKAAAAKSAPRAAADPTMKVSESMEMRLQLCGLVDPVAGGDVADSRMGAIFVHLAQRIVRLSRHHSFQLEFLSHCIVGAAAVFAARSDGIVKLFPDDVYNATVAVYTLLRRIRLDPADLAAELEEANKKKKEKEGAEGKKDSAGSSGDSAPAASSNTNEGGLRKRKGGKEKKEDEKKGNSGGNDKKGVDDKESKAEEGEASAVDAIVALATSSEIEGLRKACVAFLYATAGVMRGIENSLLKDDDNNSTPEEVKDAIRRRASCDKIAALLAEPKAKDLIALMRDQHKKRMQQYSGGVSSLWAFFVAPLLIVVALTAVAALWSPSLLPEPILLAISPLGLTRLSPRNEWVRYAGSAMAASAIIYLLSQMLSYSGVGPLPMRSATVHAFLAHDPDIALLHSSTAGATALEFSLFAPPPALVAEEKEKERKEKEEKKKAENGDGKAATEDEKPEDEEEEAEEAVDSDEELISGRRASASSRGKAPSIDDWPGAMGMRAENVATLLQAYNTAFTVEEQIYQLEAEESERLSRLERKSKQSAAEAEEEGNKDKTPTKKGKESAASEVDADTDSPRTLTVQIPPTLLSSLSNLYFRLEELGEVGAAEAVLARYRFIENLLEQSGYSAAGGAGGADSNLGPLNEGEGEGEGGYDGADYDDDDGEGEEGERDGAPMEELDESGIGGGAGQGRKGVLEAAATGAAPDDDEGQE